MERRTALKAIPLAIAGITATAKGSLGPIGPIPGVLDELALSYSIELITDASTSGISCSFVAFALHLSTLAKAGDSEALHATVERLLDSLYEEHDQYDEPRETWIAEESKDFADVVVMDNSSNEEAEFAIARSRARHERRCGGEA